jgi:hypothetical protein
MKTNQVSVKLISFIFRVEKLANQEIGTKQTARRANRIQISNLLIAFASTVIFRFGARYDSRPCFSSVSWITVF